MIVVVVLLLSPRALPMARQFHTKPSIRYTPMVDRISYSKSNANDIRSKKHVNTRMWCGGRLVIQKLYEFNALKTYTRSFWRWFNVGTTSSMSLDVFFLIFGSIKISHWWIECDFRRNGPHTCRVSPLKPCWHPRPPNYYIRIQPGSPLANFVSNSILS